jgi:hypothetical protein
MSETRDELGVLLFDTRKQLERLRFDQAKVRARGDFAPYHALAIQREIDTECDVLSAIERIDRKEGARVR